MWGQDLKKKNLNPARCSRRTGLLSSETGFERQSLRFWEIMEAERKMTEQGKFTEEIKTVRRKLANINKKHQRRGKRLSMIRAGRRMNTDRLREILLLLCFHERGNCILFSRLAGLLTHLEQYLPNWSHIPLHDKESDPPRTCTPCGRYGLLLRKTQQIDFQQMVRRCTLTNCL